MDQNSRLTKTLVLTEDGLYEIDTIATTDKIWLAPEWIDNMPSVGFCKPAKTIRIDQLGVKESPPNQGVEFILQGKLPKDVLFGENTSAEGIDYEIEVLPNLFFDIQDVPSVN